MPFLIWGLDFLLFFCFILVHLYNFRMQARYYVDEVKDKSDKDIDVSSWEEEFVEDLPEQENG